MINERRIKEAVDHGRIESAGREKRCGWTCDTVKEAIADVEAIKATGRKAHWHQDRHPTSGVLPDVHVTFFDPVAEYMQPYSLICRVMDEVNHWRFGSLFQAKNEGTSATYIIGWETGEVWFPTIQENTWSDEWHLADANLTARCLELNAEFNPFSYDYKKIRRRVEDALRKSNSKQELLEIAAVLKVKLI